MQKLKAQHKHIMKLIDRDKLEDGWTSVSDMLYPHLLKNIPDELVKFSGDIGQYKAKLTKEGNGIIKALKWL